MIDEPAQGIRGEESFNYRRRQLHFQTKPRDAPSNFIVVRQVICQSFKSADRRQIPPPESEGRSESETDTTFYQPSRQHSGTKIGADGKRFQSRANAGAGNAAVEASYQSNFGIGERSYHSLQVVRLSADIAVVHHQIFVPGL